MSRSQLKTYGPQARRDFIAMVTREAAVYGLTKSKIAPVDVSGDTAVIQGTAYPKKVARQRGQLEQLIERQGFEQTMEAMAYTWFNRFMAIRYMELHGYLDHGYRVLSHPTGETTPEILQYAERVDLPGLDKQAVIDLKLDGARDPELYRMLLLAQCNALHAALPFLFERIDDATELLLPKDLLHSESVIRKMVEAIDEEDWREVEIVGWLYQFYISEKKDRVIGKVVKSEDIPAATQLFTPNWIVKYMLHNSLGAKWLATYPQSPLKAQMEYYIEPAEQDADVQRQLAEITPDSLNPEEITLLDPACGSGHILVEAYELFKAIYQERGYRAKDIPRLILQKNLYGLEIDDRAAQLASFALLMKARADDRTLFSKPVGLNVCCIQESNGLEIDDARLKALFHNAKTYGSLIRAEEDLGFNLGELASDSVTEPQGDQLYIEGGTEAKNMLIRQARILAGKYDVVVANPPYMGSKGMNGLLKSFANDKYPNSKSDLFAMFIERGFDMVSGGLGFNVMITMESWMFLSSYENFRAEIIGRHTIRNLGHFPYDGKRPTVMGINFGVAVVNVLGEHIPKYCGHYCCSRHYELRDDGVPIEFPSRNERVANTRQDEFTKIPGSPIAYWASPNLVRAFESNPALSEKLDTAQGMKTLDNERFVREWPEVSIQHIGGVRANSSSDSRWYPINHGGDYRKWYGNNESVLNWKNNGTEIKALAIKKYNSVTRTVTGMGYYLRSGITWTAISSSSFGIRYFPCGYLFTNAGMCAFGDESHVKSGGCLLNSNASRRFLEFISPTLNFGPNQVKQVPFPESIDTKVCNRIFDIMVKHAKADWDAYERSWEFQSVPILVLASVPTSKLESSYTAWFSQARDTIAGMKRLEEENNRLFIEAYGLQDELTPEVPIEQITLTVNPPYRYGPGKTDEEYEALFRTDTMKELLSYAVGCMMGRYSLDEPGLIYAHSGNEGFDPSRYATYPADDDGILPITDIDWFEDDIANRAVEFIATAWPKEHLEENLEFLADSLGRKKTESSRECIRRYLSRDFYKDHLQTYKRRPIYWLFTSGKQRAFQCLVYLHRYNEGTLARMRTEYVIPLQSKLSARLEHLKDDIAAASSTAQAKKLEKEQDLLRKQQAELQTFDEKLRHYADQRIALDLDDGVKVNYGKFGDLLAEVKAVTGEAPKAVK